MRIKVYIVTYNNDDILRKCLTHLYRSDLVGYDFRVTVLNNYGRLKGFEQYENSFNFRVLNNECRPDFSNGHLARSWNQALMDAFVDLNEPQTDLAVLIQNDTFVKPNCFFNLIEEHKKYDFIQFGVGDQFMSFNVEAVKTIGMFDERFIAIQYQEADYFMSAYYLHKNKISINDRMAHEREWNPIENVSERFIEEDFGLNKHVHTHRWSEMNRKIFYAKWNSDPQNWTKYISTYTPQLHIDRFYTYPYFEKNIKTLNEQRYVHFFENPGYGK